MSLGNEIVLRPRFKLDLNENNTEVLQRFEDAKLKHTDFVISRIDNHVFIRIPKKDQHFWSPQLHLEIVSFEQGKSILTGLFGPNPTVWTMFMFFHFLIAVLFCGLLVWAYSNWALKTSYMLQAIGAGTMVVCWFILYFAGRLGKDAGKEEMHKLYEVMNRIVYNT